MALIEKFYNNDRARDIREILTKNFDNVAKYIPNDFIILDTIGRHNLNSDYKTEFKLVFDREEETVYRWSEAENNWSTYLIRAKDEYARREANTNSDSSFADATLGVNMDGDEDPYTLTFYSRQYTKFDPQPNGTEVEPHPLDSVTFAAENIQYDEVNSVRTIVEKIIDNINDINNFIGTREGIDSIFDEDYSEDKTIINALLVLNNQIISNKDRLDGIEDGTIIVPKAAHADLADLANTATEALNSQRLGNELPSFYATAENLAATQQSLNDTQNKLEIDENNIAELQERTQGLRTDLDNLSSAVENNYEEYQDTKDLVEQMSGDVGNAIEQVANLKTQVGWEILLV